MTDEQYEARQRARDRAYDGPELPPVFDYEVLEYDEAGLPVRVVYCERCEQGIDRIEVQAPTFEELRDMMFDGVARSILDLPVEPDGHDPHGSPSWLLVAGLI